MAFGSFTVHDACHVMFAVLLRVVGDVLAWRPVHGHYDFISCAFVVFAHRRSAVFILDFLCSGVGTGLSNLVIHVITTHEFVSPSPCTLETV